MLTTFLKDILYFNQMFIHSFKKNKQMFVYTQLRVPYNPFPYISYFTEQPFSSLLAAFFGIYLDFFH